MSGQRFESGRSEIGECEKTPHRVLIRQSNFDTPKRGKSPWNIPGDFPLLPGSGAGIRTQDLQVMSSNPEMGTLDRQAGLPRVALRDSIPPNPASRFSLSPSILSPLRQMNK